MEIVERLVEEIIPYEKNPRQNALAVEKVAESIREYGFKVPIVLDVNNVIIAGHTRLKAAKFLGLETVPCVVAADLTEEQARAYRLVDNRVAEFSEWDKNLLETEIDALKGLGISLEGFGFDAAFLKGLDVEAATKINYGEFYTSKVNPVYYEITDKEVTLADLVETGKAEALIKAIDESEVTLAEKEFLRLAAQRHNVFNYSNIAEYYARATPEMQALMEASALVIIDYEKAIKQGYVRIHEIIEEEINNYAQ